MAIMNEKGQHDIAVVVFANRKDFFFTKICVASIRYYYPDVEIYLVKDQLNGRFNTNTLCETFNVKVLPLKQRYFGWGAAKLLFILNHALSGKRCLCMDSDIVFVGKVLDKLNKETADFIVHPEEYKQPFTDMVKSVFLDPEKIAPYYPDYVYPGFFFNSGQFVVTTNLFKKDIFLPAFNPEKFPYYQNPGVFPLVDQSILNIVAPIMAQRKELSISGVPFMLWSVDFFKNPENTHIEKFSDGSHQFLIHYAGDVRTCHIEKMKGFELLSFFREFYFKRLSKKRQLTEIKQDNRAEHPRLSKILYYKNRVYIEMLRKLKLL